ncbi:hypothetical protein DRQ26_00715 [bacterium]|nr:MAG: hypothetical protein DRQ26_00715 [bacterium]
MRIDLKLQLENVFGGDGFLRPHEIEELKLARSKQRIVIREDIGIPVTSSSKERKVEKREVEVNTFRRDDQGNYYLKLGGSHGKLWGAMKEAGYLLYQAGRLKSKSMTDRVLKAVQVLPDWVMLENVESVKVETIPQVLNTMGNSMVQLYFDVITKCEAKITLVFPDQFKDLIFEYLRYIQTMNCLNKRRGRITILSELPEEKEGEKLNLFK